nr:hypothetical protein CFP56_71955 [Quercus suber]
MPPTRRSTTERHPPVSSRPIAHFEFPPDHHLLVTTPSGIAAWDAAGLHKIFQSSKSGIAAAREANDGSNLLAVADQHVVVLHDARRGWEKSWGLNADEDEVRLLEYAPDAKTLLLSTNHANEVQQYSIEQSRLMSSTRIHETPPTAMAVSSTGHLMVSASDNPPTLYLKSLSHNSEPVMIQPRASEAPVVVAAFHPERANIFLLAFRDGTLAAYDATKIIRRAHGLGRFGDQERVNDGEIAHIDNVHRTTTKIVTKDSIGIKATSITAASFLPGHKTRGICAGSDGRCRLVDFDDGGIVLRTWHAKAPVTSLSVVSTEPARARPVRLSQNVAKLKGADARRPVGTSNFIAVGRSDGKVHIYNSIGLLLAQKTVSQNAQKIISVEWVKGGSPQTMSGVTDQTGNRVPEVSRRMDTELGKQHNRQVNSVKQATADAEETALNHHLGLPPTLHQSSVQEADTTSFRTRKFTTHPDELGEGSVRRTTRKGPAVPQFIGPSNAYVDLFSPIKPLVKAVPEVPKRAIASPPRSRPRISSHTFVQDGRAGPEQSPPFAIKHDDTTLSDPEAISNTGLDTSNQIDARQEKLAQEDSSMVISTRARRRRSSRKQLLSSTQVCSTDTAIPTNEDAMILANIRKLSSNQHTGSVLGPFSNKVMPLKPRRDNTISRIAKRNNYLKKHKLFSPAEQKVWDPGNVLEREAAWVTDSNQDRSSDEMDDAEPGDDTQPEPERMLGDTDGSADIWMTSADETANQHPLAGRRKRRKHLLNSPFRHNLVAKNPSPQASSIYSQATRSRNNESPAEDMRSAQTHFSPERGLSPSSRDICDLFPRTSSLSSPRRPVDRTRKVFRHHSSSLRKGLKEIHPNMSPPKNSPWTRAKASKMASANPSNAGDPVTDLARSPPIACFECASNNSRIAGLESEVLRLKGEALALKAVLRRHGLLLPPGLGMT